MKLALTLLTVLALAIGVVLLFVLSEATWAQGYVPLPVGGNDFQLEKDEQSGRIWHYRFCDLLEKHLQDSLRTKFIRDETDAFMAQVDQIADIAMSQQS